VPLTIKEINTKRIVLSQLINQNAAVHHLSPTVSVIIPVYNQLKYTIAAVESILRSATKVTYEILIIDDRSTDETAQFFAPLAPLRCITQPTNQGFIAACNRGAIEARGDYLVFLNNDVHVLSGWLDGLYDSFTLRNNIGLVGSQLIYPDGFLQEAGGIIWADGRGWNYGRGAYPMQPEYTYARPVDYCSGASIMVPAQLFASLGGFATEYQPAYYEDVDLAMKTRAEGYEVIYQPSSKVVHFEGVSSGRDMTSGTKAYQTRNHELFVKKWSYDLGSRPIYASEPDKAAVRNFRGRILFADATTPTPDQDAGSVVADMYMQVLLQLGYHVTFVPVDNFLGIPKKYTQLLEKKGVYCPRRPYFTSLTEFLTQQTDNGIGSFDLVIALRYACAREVFRILDSIGDHTPRIFFPIDLHYLREERMAGIDNSVEILLNSLKTKHEEFSVLVQADSICVHSDYERSHLLETMPTLDVHVTPILYPVPDYTTTTFADRHDVLFVGGFRHPPNADGILWFLREVWPLVTPRLPGVRLRIAGSHMPAEITVMASDSVEILGFVEDLDPILTSTRLSIAPLRYGAGVKGKVTLSMCNGIPVIGTTVAFEGMSLVHGHEVLCADTASEFAEHLVAAYRDEALWNTLSNGAVARAQREYSISGNLQLFQSIIDRVQAKQRIPHLKHKTH
jgi:GT2 family glycosyltransferase/glycosyltransferase involved in cell wall biosynthesis